MKNHKSPLIFIHIPKTAGTTVNQILLNEYRNEIFFEFDPPVTTADFNKLTNQEKQKISIIKGLFEFGIHNYFPGKIDYFTFFRNPIDRSISGFNFIYSKREHPFHNEMVKNQYSLKDILNGGYIKNFDNCHVRFLSGLKDIDYGSVNEEVYQKALSNFDNYFQYFGLSERFDESIFLMKQNFNWKMPFYLKYNVNKNYVLKKIDSETLDLLEHYNKYDLALYEHALKKFDQIISQKGWQFQLQLSIFKLLNLIYKPFKLAHFIIIKPEIK